MTDRKAPKKMGRSAMRTRLPYASAVPSGVATNFTVALSASVPLESVAFRASSTAEASEAETCSASDMLFQRRASGGPVLERWQRLTDGWRWKPRSCGSHSGNVTAVLQESRLRPRFLKMRSERRTQRGALTLPLFPTTKVLLRLS